jgi:enamine deaminase RidA (YjgF/YER057c/UK114 family)
MAKQIIHTDEAPKSLAGYGQAVKASGLIFVSGQGPFDPKTGEVIGTTIQEQTKVDPIVKTPKVPFLKCICPFCGSEC